MRLRGKNAVLIGAEGSSPPLPYIEVEDGEAATLIRLGLGVEVTDEEAPAPAAKEPKGKKAKAEEPKVEAPPPPAAPVEPEPAPPAEEPKADDERAETILHALDLVEPAGLEAEGDRKGKPTVAAIEEITGLKDVTVEEIDAAVAAHEPA